MDGWWSFVRSDHILLCLVWLDQVGWRLHTQTTLTHLCVKTAALRKPPHDMKVSMPERFLHVFLFALDARCQLQWESLANSSNASCQFVLFMLQLEHVGTVKLRGVKCWVVLPKSWHRQKKFLDTLVEAQSCGLPIRKRTFGYDNCSSFFLFLSKFFWWRTLRNTLYLALPWRWALRISTVQFAQTAHTHKREAVWQTVCNFTKDMQRFSSQSLKSPDIYWNERINFTSFFCAFCWFFAEIQSDLRLPGYYASMTVPCLEHFSCQRRNASNVKVLEISHSRKQEYTCRFPFVLFNQIYDDVFSRLCGPLWVCLSLFHDLPLLLLPFELFGDLSCKVRGLRPCHWELVL